jgi:hypothetical protein
MNTDYTPINIVTGALDIILALPNPEKLRLCRLTERWDRRDTVMVQTGDLGRIAKRQKVSIKLATTLQRMAQEARA